MTILQKLHQQLRQEFPGISPALTQSVIWFVSGGMSHETFTDKCARLLSETEFSSEDEKNDFLYDILLTSGRNACQSQALLNHFKSAIQKSTANVKQKQLAKEQPISGFQSSAAALTAGSSSALFDDSKKGKRPRDVAFHKKELAQTTPPPGRGHKSST